MLAVVDVLTASETSSQFKEDSYEGLRHEAMLRASKVGFLFLYSFLEATPSVAELAEGTVTSSSWVRSAPIDSELLKDFWRVFDEPRWLDWLGTWFGEIRFDPESLRAWSAVGKLRQVWFSQSGEPICGGETPTKPSLAFLSELRRVLRKRERLNRMSGEQRALYEKIHRIRDAIGRVDFDVVQALRELRDDD